MNIALIICTYMRPASLEKLLTSVRSQTKVPSQIIVVDASTNHETEKLFQSAPLVSADYFLVSDEHRGLTKQRNFGVQQLNSSIDVVCFLDDDLILEPDYFEQIEHTYLERPNAIGVGGIDLKDNGYFQKDPDVSYSNFN